MKPAILLHGNCQAGVLTTIAQAIPSLQDHFTFKHVAWYVHEITDWARTYGPEFMSDVRVVWEQVEGGQIAEHRAEMHRRLPADCQVIRFPPLWMTTLWPFMGSDPRRASSSRYIWSDSIAVQLVKEDLPDEELYAKYMRLSTERMPDLDRRLRLDATRWRTTDELSDIKLADYVLERFRKTRLFYTAGHISAPPLRHILRELINRTELIKPTALEATLDLDVLLRHHGGHEYQMVPIHPLVAERLGLEYFDPNERHRYHAHYWTHKEYILNYIRWAPFLG
jgi:hypothetical protein